MGKNKVLVKVHPEGKYVVDLDKSIDIAQVWLLTNLAYVHITICRNSGRSCFVPWKEQCRRSIAKHCLVPRSFANTLAVCHWAGDGRR